MFKKNPEKYRGSTVIILSVFILLLIVVQFAMTLIPCVPVEKYETQYIDHVETKVNVGTTMFTIAEVMFDKADTVTDWRQGDPNYSWNFTLNGYADMIAYATGLGITVVIMSLISLKCFATHIVSVVWAVWAPISWYSARIWEMANQPVADTIYTVTLITLFAGAALVFVRTGLYLYHRFFVPFVNWRKADKAWKAEYEAALAAEKAEVAAN